MRNKVACFAEIWYTQNRNGGIGMKSFLVVVDMQKDFVDAACCAGVTSETHDAALTTMKSCQIEVCS